MKHQDFRKQAHQLVDWMADYMQNIEAYPVKAQVKPGEIYQTLPETPPTEGESFEIIMEDFQQKIMPGMTHWQHPSFFAYFSANNSFPSILGEMLTATLGAQCMIWDTSPAAAELEEKVMNWLKGMMGIPSNFEGVIQDTASTATLCAILTAREKWSNYQINQRGFSSDKLRIYCSSQTHSSIDKAVKIAGIGIENLVKIKVDSTFAMIPAALETAIQQDLEDGFHPLCVMATIGTTSSTAIDPVRAIGEVCQKYELFFHVDAAYAGTASILPEKRWMLDGLELADTYLFNPHKWMLTNFDCTAYFVKDKVSLIRTFEILPEYLKTTQDTQVNNYRDWGIQLGRRFRALKLWFVIRSFGVEGLRTKIRHHLELAISFQKKLDTHEDFEILAPVPLNLICFRYKPQEITNEKTLTKINQQLMDSINQTGQAYLTHTKLDGKYALRLAIGQTNVTKKHTEAFWKLLILHTKK